MALVVTPTWTINLSFKDINNNPSSLTVYYPGSESAGNVQGYATTTLIPAVAGISNALLVGWNYSFGAKETDPAILNNPDVGSQVERKGSFTFLDSGLGYMNLEVPSIRPELVVKGSNVIDPANPAIAAFVDAIVDTGLADLNGATNFRGLSLVRLNSLQQIHRKNSRG